MRFLSGLTSLGLVIGAFALVTVVPSCGGGGGGGGGAPTGGIQIVEIRSDGGTTLPTDSVFLNERIVIEFSTAIDPASVNQDSVQIRRRRVTPTGTIPVDEFTVPALGDYVVSGQTVTFVPQLPTVADLTDAGYLLDSLYQVRVVGFPEFDAVRSFDGTPLVADFVTTFNTRSAQPFLLDPVPGPPVVVAVGMDLNGDGVVDADGDSSTPNTEEFFDFGVIPFRTDAPVGLASAPLTFSVFLSEPVLPDSVLADGDGDGNPDNVFVMDVTNDIELPSRIELVQEFDSDADRFNVVINLIPDTTLPAGVRVRPVVGSAIADFASPPFNLSEFEPEFETMFGPAAFADALVETYEDRRRADPSSTAEWNAENSRALVSGLGIGGTGVDGALIVDPGTSLTIDTTVNDGFFNFTEINLQANSVLNVIGNNPLRLFCTGDVTISGTIDVSGQKGENGVVGDNDHISIGGPGVAGGANGGRSNTTARGPGAVPNGGGEGGASGNMAPGGGGGAGHARAGSSGRPVNVASGRGGVSYGNPAVQPLLGGSGGGGGGRFSAGGDRIPPDNGGGGGGAGGGIIVLDVAGTFTLAGSIRADGGAGGDGAPSTPTGGAGGGGGSGGGIRIRAFSIADIQGVGTFLTAQGGTGGTTGGGAASPGSGGSDGRIYMETFDANRDGQPNDFSVDRTESTIAPQERRGTLNEGNLGRSKALSRFIDTGTKSAVFSFDGSDPITGDVVVGPEVEDIVIPAGIPEEASVTIQFQGAHEDPMNPRSPDLENLSEFTTQVEDLNGYQFIRYEITFNIGSDIAVAERIVIEELKIRFTFDI